MSGAGFAPGEAAGVGLVAAQEPPKSFTGLSFADTGDASGEDSPNRRLGDRSPSKGKAMFAQGAAASRSATRMLTANITQQQIMRQVTADEELSADTSLCGSISKVGADGQSVKTGEELLAASIQRDRMLEQIRRTVFCFSKDMKVTGISRRQLLRAVMEDEKQFKTCMTLPMTLFFALIFIVFFQVRYATGNMYLNETMLREAVTPFPYSAQNAGDVYNWMEGTMFPFLWSMPNVNPDAASDKSDAKTQQLVGGAILRTAVSAPIDPCKNSIAEPGAPVIAFDPRTGVNWTMPCTNAATAARRLSERGWESTWSSWMSSAPSFQQLDESTTVEQVLYTPPSETNEERIHAKEVKKARRLQNKAVPQKHVQDARAHRLAQVRSGMPLPLRTVDGRQLEKHQHQDKSRRLKLLKRGYLDLPTEITANVLKKIIPASMTLDSINDLIDEARKTTDTSTLFISLQFWTRNEEMKILTRSTVTFMFSRGGQLYTSVQMQSGSLQFTGASGILFAVWILLLIRLTVVNIITGVLAIKHNTFRRTILNGNSVSDWLMILLGWTIVAMVAAEAVGLSQHQKDWSAYKTDIAQVIGKPDEREDVDKRWMKKFDDQLTPVNEVSDGLLIWVSVYTVLMVSRYLIATLGHPRLAVVVRPLLVGFSDLVHFGIVFLSVYIAYVLSGPIILGRRIEEMSTFKGSFGYCIKMVFERQFEITLMTSEDMFATALWMVSFALALILVLVNLLLAIIFNHYAIVREEVSVNDTVVHFISRLFTQLKLQSAWISNTDLLVKLLTIPVTESPNLVQLKRKLPDVSEAQIDIVYSAAVQRASQKVCIDAKHALPEHFANLLLMIRDVRKSIVRIQEASTENPYDEPIVTDVSKQVPNLDNPVVPQVEGGVGGDVSKQAKEADAEKKPRPKTGEMAPSDKPDWIHHGLNITLCNRRENLGSLLQQMDALSKRMEARGIKGPVGLPLTKPHTPDFETPFYIVDEGKDCSKF